MPRIKYTYAYLVEYKTFKHAHLGANGTNEERYFSIDQHKEAIEFAQNHKGNAPYKVYIPNNLITQQSKCRI